EGVPYTIIPGPSAVLTGYLASGFPGEFTFFGFLPAKGEERARKLEEVLSCEKVGILFEAPHRIERLLREIGEKTPDRPLFLGKELTKKFEKYYWGTPLQLLEEIGTPKGEWVVVISPAPPSGKWLGSLQQLIREIEKLELPPKQKAKLLSKVTGEPVKEIYNRLIK
ncbi:MAG: SAM-dependent methyltransferase, partial [Campylobacterales bacterium]